VGHGPTSPAITLDQILETYRRSTIAEHGNNPWFERLIAAYLRTDPVYAGLFTHVWLWSEFPSRNDFGPSGKDVSIDIVARTKDGAHWAIQCKCFKESATVDKPTFDTFLSTSGRSFTNTLDASKGTHFACRLWSDTTIKGFDREAESAITNQTAPVQRIGYLDLRSAPGDWGRIASGFSGHSTTHRKLGTKHHQSTAIAQVHHYRPIAQDPHAKRGRNGPMWSKRGVDRMSCTLSRSTSATGDRNREGTSSAPTAHQSVTPPESCGETSWSAVSESESGRTLRAKSIRPEGRVDRTFTHLSLPNLWPSD